MEVTFGLVALVICAIVLLRAGIAAAALTFVVLLFLYILWYGAYLILALLALFALLTWFFGYTRVGQRLWDRIAG